MCMVIPTNWFNDSLLTLSRVSVLIPSYTVRFSRGKYKPLGIAYAELGSLEDAQKAIESLNGSIFKDRSLKVRLHVPYKPRIKLSVETKAEARGSPISLVSLGGSAQVSEHDANELNETSLPKSPRPALSDDTLFISNVHHKVTEELIRQHFDDKPTTVYRYTPKNRKRTGSISFRHSPISYFVTFGALEDKSLDDIVGEYKSKKLNGRFVLLRKAFADRLELIKIANQEPQPAQIDESETENSIINELQGQDET